MAVLGLPLAQALSGVAQRLLRHLQRDVATSFACGGSTWPVLVSRRCRSMGSAG